MSKEKEQFNISPEEKQEIHNDEVRSEHYEKAVEQLEKEIPISKKFELLSEILFPNSMYKIGNMPVFDKNCNRIQESYISDYVGKKSMRVSSAKVEEALTEGMVF